MSDSGLVTGGEGSEIKNMLLLFMLMACVSCSISKENQGTYLMVLDHTIRMKAKIFPNNFEHPRTRSKLRLEFIRKSWRGIFGSNQTSVKLFYSNDAPQGKMRKIMEALSAGLIFLPLPGKNNTFDIYSIWSTSLNDILEITVINTTVEGLLAFRSGSWCQDPLWANTPACHAKDHPNPSLLHMGRLLEAIRREAVLTTCYRGLRRELIRGVLGRTC